MDEDDPRSAMMRADEAAILLEDQGYKIAWSDWLEEHHRKITYWERDVEEYGEAPDLPPSVLLIDQGDSFSCYFHNINKIVAALGFYKVERDDDSD